MMKSAPDDFTFYDSIGASSMQTREKPPGQMDQIDISMYVGDLWDMQSFETDAQYGAFKIYLNMKPIERTMGGSWRIYIGDPNRRGVASSFQRWYKKNNWKLRARAWDSFRAQQEREAEMEAIRKEAKNRVSTYGNLMLMANVIIGKADMNTLTKAEARAMLHMLTALVDTGARGQRLELGQPQQLVQMNVTSDETAGELTLDKLEKLAAGSGDAFRHPPSLEELGEEK